MSTERRRRMPRAQRERQMVTVAEEMFAERGYQAASMDEIAERVGVSKPMLYEYFGSKEGLLVACIRRARAELLAAITGAVDGVANPEDALRAGLVAFFEFTDSHRRAWQLIRREAVAAGQAAADEIEAIRAQQSAIDAALLARFRPDAPQRDLEAAAEIIVGACERLSIWYVERDGLDRVTAKQAAEYVMDLLWYGLRSTLGSPT
ncbi:TetR/AcrR family transcriptional regulator [Actinophytocola sp.]|uniref:TetR/AcrR family transcriptional regulator n=1 Tax=Actinophytocola sp. TaxID=1872138 RepID=UPI002D7F6457|nr:TetR/AcrR family transcriptional regulator [Actinophytocola sp.]HET9143245.1 TetR/AcrR family transcriptional regulator [Actinophytocola sp.]